MRRPLAILAVIALVVAACGDGGAADVDTTTAATAPDEETTAAPTTLPAPDSWPTCFKSVANYPDVEACANLDLEDPEVRGEDADPADSTGGLLLRERPDGNPLDHFCLVQQDHVFVVLAEDFHPDDFDLAPVVAEDLAFSGELEEDEKGSAEDALDLYEGLGLGLFLVTDGVDVLAKINDIQEKGFEASPHYVLGPTPTWKYGPHTAVRALTGWNWSQLPITREDGAGAPVEDGARVVVIDTGATGDPGSDIGLGVAEPEGDVDPFVKGHGVFAASIVKQFNPALTVDLYRAGFKDGTLTEASVTAALRRAAPAGEAVVNLSLGTYECAVEYGSLGLTAALSSLEDTVGIVAASGNDAESHPNHPTMFPARLGMGGGLLSGQVTAVGALDVNGDPAVWSSPAEVLAPGENLVGWHHDGNTGGLAVWSGTSFAAPHFAACLASRLCEAP